MKDVPNKLGRKEAFVKGMAPQSQSNVAVQKDVPTKLSREGFVSGMAPQEQSNVAVQKDVPTKLSWEGFVSGMVQSERGSVLAAMKDVPTQFRREC